MRRSLIRFAALVLGWLGFWLAWLAWCGVVRFAGDPTSALVRVPSGFPMVHPAPALLAIPLLLTGLAAFLWAWGRTALGVHFGAGYLGCALALGMAQALASSLLGLESTARLAPVMSSLTLGVWGLPGLVTRTVTTPSAIGSLSLPPALLGLVIALLLDWWRRRNDRAAPSLSEGEHDAMAHETRAF